MEKIVSEEELTRVNATVREWIGLNPDVYQQFKQRVNDIGSDDLTLVERMMQLLNDCMPQDARSFYKYIFNFLTKPEQMTDTTGGFSRYDSLAEKCLFQHKRIAVNLETGEVVLHSGQAVRGWTIIQIDDFELEVQHCPQSMKTLINEQIRRLMWEFGFDATTTDLAALNELGMQVAKTVYVYSLLFLPDFLSELGHRIKTDQKPLAFCIYYFITFDHGLTQLTRVFTLAMTGEYSCIFTNEMFKLCIKTFTACSLKAKLESKEEWLHLASDINNDDAWREIAFTAKDIKTTGGRHSDTRSLEELLIGDVPRLEAEIQHFQQEEQGVIHLAYLLFSLRASHHIGECCYATFHRALQNRQYRSIGRAEVAQKRYNELLDDPSNLNKGTKKWQEAKEITDYWTEVFSKID